jgi:hypothetical protein
MPKMIGSTIAFSTSVDVTLSGDTILTLADGVDQIRVTVAGGVIPAIIGIIGGEDTQAVAVINAAGVQIVIYAEHTNAPSTARFIQGTILDAGCACLLWRCPYTQSWRILLSGGTV